MDEAGYECHRAKLYPRRTQRYNHKRKAEVAQLVEQLIRNQQVIGSSPIFGSIDFDVKMGIIVPRGTYSFCWIYAHINWIINSKDFENIFGVAAGSQFHRKKRT